MRELVRQAALAPAGRALADRRDRGRRPAQRPGRRRVAQEHRGAAAADGVAAVRADGRRRRCRRSGRGAAPLVLADAVRRQAVADHLIARDGVAESVAIFAARASQGHIGRARALALDEATRNRRREVLRIPQPADRPRVVHDVRQPTSSRPRPRRPSRAPQTLDAQGARRPRGRVRRRLARRSRPPASRRPRRSCSATRSSGPSASCAMRSTGRCSISRRSTATCSRFSSGRRRSPGQRGAAAGGRSIARNTTGEMSAARLAAIFATREALEGEVAPVAGAGVADDLAARCASGVSGAVRRLLHNACAISAQRPTSCGLLQSAQRVPSHAPSHDPAPPSRTDTMPTGMWTL